MNDRPRRTDGGGAEYGLPVDIDVADIVEAEAAECAALPVQRTVAASGLAPTQRTGRPQARGGGATLRRHLQFLEECPKCSQR